MRKVTASDPGGALAFASLQLLADREEGAQFWLQFAAGGGQATGAICLYLMHLRRGEWRDAKYWARQIETLEREPCQYASVPYEVVDATTSPSGPDGALTVFLDLPDHAATVPEDAIKDAVDELDVDRIDGFGTIPPAASRATSTPISTTSSDCTRVTVSVFLVPHPAEKDQPVHGCSPQAGATSSAKVLPAARARVVLRPVYCSAPGRRFYRAAGCWVR